MKKISVYFMIVLLSLTFFSCKSDNGVTEPEKVQEDIVGVWVSEGENVAPLLVALLNVTKLTAVFNPDGTYAVTQEDTTGSSFTLAGTYSVSKSNVGNIYTIKVNQQSPIPVTSEGIYEIDKSTTPWTMKYEIVQTNPSIAATPPTPEGGFGSTNNGVMGTMNVQKFVKQ